MEMRRVSGINETSAVKEQYSSSCSLGTRINLHAKYSTNKQGFGNWIAGHYRFAPGSSVLELGCGTGSMWAGKDALTESCSRLVLSDLSEGMLETAKDTLACFPGISYEVIDIQDIPYPDSSFDAVIANMMLYHVPDIRRGLGEVRRVLREGGAFYCATFGEHGIMEYIAGIFRCRGYDIKDDTDHAFTLQNGGELLREFFSEVTRYDYEDSLEVTDVGDMADYILSLSGMSALRNIPRERMISVLSEHAGGGALRVPKEYGMFVCG